jgi:hypothetical protein
VSRALVIECTPRVNGASAYSIRERGRGQMVAGPFPDAAKASVEGRSMAQERGVELWLEDRDDRGRVLPPRRLWPPSSGISHG